MTTRVAMHGWRIGDAGHTVFGPPREESAPERIATLHGPGIKRRAHGRLIAAAPLLRDALESLVDRITALGMAERFPDLDEAKRAIALAEGAPERRTWPVTRGDGRVVDVTIPENDRQRGDDDGVEYADPRDELAERRRD